MSTLTGKRILVTGGAGFLGRHVVERLRRGDSGPVFAPRSRGYDLRLRCATPNGTEQMFEDFRPEVVIHCAAKVGGIGFNQRCPGELFYDNLMIGANVIDCCRTFEVEKVVVVSTCCAYPRCTPAPFIEEYLFDGRPDESNEPYGAAKRVLLNMLWAYQKQYGLRFAYLIPANLFGPGDSFDLEDSHVVPAMVRKFVDARDAGAPSVTLWGSGRPTREFLFVRDAADAIVLAAERYDGAEPVNLAGCGEVSIGKLMMTVRRLTKYQGEVVWDEARPEGQPRRWLDGSRAAHYFGWRATTGLEAGLRETVEWYEAQRKREVIAATA